ncbi:MAG: rod shape-determining protein MreD [Xanthomonadales bacterium]|nr:rod shape-determining protein MreD [Xanthomonadales bacterium]
MSRRRVSFGLIAATFAAALALTVVPLPDSLVWFRPYWVAMVLIYWCIESPEQVGMGTGFTMGLLLDLMTGSLAGQHALGLVIVAYIIGRIRFRMRFFPLWQQAAVVCGVLLNDRIIYTWIQGLAGYGVPDWRIAWAPLVVLFIWPWVFLILDLTRQRFRTR